MGFVHHSSVIMLSRTLNIVLLFVHDLSAEKKNTNTNGNSLKQNEEEIKTFACVSVVIIMISQQMLVMFFIK